MSAQPFFLETEEAAGGTYMLGIKIRGLILIGLLASTGCGEFDKLIGKKDDNKDSAEESSDGATDSAGTDHTASGDTTGGGNTTGGGDTTGGGATTVGNSVTMPSGKVLQLGEQQNVAVIKDETLFASWNNNGFTDESSRTDLMKDVYGVFKDDFDFVVVLSNNDSPASGTSYVGKATQLANSALNIGMLILDENNQYQETWDDSAKYGSASKLKGMMHITFLDGMKNGPILHELAHTWGVGTNWIPFKKLSCNSSTCSEVTDYTHWGYSTVGGSMNGMSVTSLGNNKYKFSGFAPNSVAYSPMELYVMGFIPLSEVPTFTYYTGLSATPTELQNLEFHATTANVVTADLIRSNSGERSPSSATAQKTFKILTIVLTPTDLSSSQWQTVEDSVKWLTQTSDDGSSTYFNFWEATGGRATMDGALLKNHLK